ncbi:hypothetical protein OGM63_29390 [Plectonema radiosum NIES-515]|uniref:Transposase n=1 Tax=Plectonema radiosum NIES-515 TaxID=2986073 RepID=A0ABT3B864_9CYAN|nr:hypothetical protein [Plectonema radiosum]MCV3217576.1 hypothetical protein [Plectonema radiosum NIES-515]
MEWEYSEILKSRKKTVVDGQDRQGFEQKNGLRPQVTLDFDDPFDALWIDGRMQSAWVSEMFLALGKATNGEIGEWQL